MLRMLKFKILILLCTKYTVVLKHPRESIALLYLYPWPDFRSVHNLILKNRRVNHNAPAHLAKCEEHNMTWDCYHPVLISLPSYEQIKSFSLLFYSYCCIFGAWNFRKKADYKSQFSQKFENSISVNSLLKIKYNTKLFLYETAAY